MDIRIIGGGAAALAFGAGGFNYVSIDEVLTDDIRYVSEISAADMQGYMDGIVRQMTDAYGFYEFQGDDYVFVADLTFDADAQSLTFNERVRSEDALSTEDRERIGAEIEFHDYCDTPDALLFTEKGFNYSVDIKDGNGAKISYTLCKAKSSGLRM